MHRFIASTTVAAYLFCTALPVSAGGAVEASGQAIIHSFEAIGYSIEGAFRLASGAAAIPFLSVGVIGEASAEIGNGLWEAADSPHSGPLPVTDEIVTTGPDTGAAQSEED